MNLPARTEEHDPETGEIKTGLPVGYAEGNQSLAVSIAMAEIDQQITTARAYPRSVTQAVKNILELATLDEETAKECIYALPRGGKPIKGPSIRLAEIIQQSWGNSRAGTRVVHVDRIEKYVEAEGVYHDLETNVATTARVRRRISDRQGRVLNEDMIIVTSNAACSIAKRNAILAGIPKAVWRRAEAAASRVIAGDVRTLVERRGEAIKAFAAFGIKPDQVFEVLGIEGLDDIGLDEMTTLIAMHASLKSGEATVEEMFPAKRPAGDSKDKPRDINSKLDALASKSKEPPEKSAGNGDEKPAPPRNHAPQDPGAGAASDPSHRGSDAATSHQQDDDVPQEVLREGRSAARRGMSRKANPYKEDGSARTTWFAGFDQEAEKAQREEG